MLQENISLLSLFDSNSFGAYVNLSFNLAQCHNIVNCFANENGEFPVQIAKFSTGQHKCFPCQAGPLTLSRHAVSPQLKVCSVCWEGWNHG